VPLSATPPVQLRLLLVACGIVMVKRAVLFAPIGARVTVGAGSVCVVTRVSDGWMRTPVRRRPPSGVAYGTTAMPYGTLMFGKLPVSVCCTPCALYAVTVLLLPFIT